MTHGEVRRWLHTAANQIRLCREHLVQIRGVFYSSIPARTATETEPPDDSPIAGPLRVYIDYASYTAEEKGELLSLISELYALQGQDRLVIDNKGTAEPIPAEVLAPNAGGR